MEPFPFSINLRSKQPIGVQLYAQLKKAIQTGVYRPGDQLPPIRELADL